jgi:hypothetical protein
MKQLLVCLLIAFSFPAMAQEVIELPGNARVITSDDNPQIIYRGYDTDDLIYRRIFGPSDRASRLETRNVPLNEFSDVCGGTKTLRDRRECQKDASEEYRKLQEKYN